MRLPFRFRAPWWAWVLTAVLVALFARLGFWQMHRAEEKKGMISAYQQAAKSAPLDLGEVLASGAELAFTQAVQAPGAYDAARTLLLDNQVSNHVVGYRVWSPFSLPSGQLVLVDRGWVKGNPDRRKLPAIQTPAGELVLRGVWQALPRPGLRLAQDDCDRTNWPRVVQYPLFEELQCLLGPDLVEGLIWLDPAEPNGFVREWDAVDFPPERHYGYALQWFSLAATLLVLFIVVNLRRIQP